MTVSLCMIVKNEEKVLVRCLESVRGVADEIIIVDTGSTDRTKEIALKYTDRVYDFVWADDFASARNFSFSKATMDYCMWFDADDLLTETDKENLIKLKETLPAATDVVMMRYNISFDEAGNPDFSYFRERIVKNGRGFKWKGRVHETIEYQGTSIYSDIAVTHKKMNREYNDRNLRIYETQIDRGEAFSPRDQFYYARELYYHGKYQEASQMFRMFLDDGKGWVENNLEALRYLAYCYYELNCSNFALTTLFETFCYDIPRAETCCDIGKHFFDRGFYTSAIFWYELALTCKRNDTSGAFVLLDCYGYLPAIQLCVCYDRIGNMERAIAYNDLAGTFHPNAKAYLQNKAYFRDCSG